MLIPLITGPTKTVMECLMYVFMCYYGKSVMFHWVLWPSICSKVLKSLFFPVLAHVKTKWSCWFYRVWNIVSGKEFLVAGTDWVKPLFMFHRPFHDATEAKYPQQNCHCSISYKHL